MRTQADQSTRTHASGWAWKTPWAGFAAAAWAFGFAAISFYWVAGGTLGSETIGPAITRPIASGDPGWIALLWATAALKVIAGLIALAVVRPWGRRAPRRLLQTTAWIACAVMALYEGIASLADHLLMVTGVISTPSGLGQTALHWHLLLWDPWWLVGGLLFGVVALTARALPRAPDHAA
ncbi:MAG TPA: DUF3995 domain-containing protein [Chloroflexota bacterium]|nr:DUF3995 domain-containing protein [Chloroflexota bacterium]